VKQSLDDFVVSAVLAQNCAGKCAKSQVLFFPTASQSFSRPELYQSFINNPSGNSGKHLTKPDD